MTLSPLTAISPLDGRYGEKLSALRPLVSEFGLIKYRVFVEIEWLQALLKNSHLPEISPLSPDAIKVLNAIHSTFSEKDAERIKAIESEINHDVKAVEYFIKEKMAAHKELKPFSEFVHFGCTSEDINNLSYALMLKDLRQHVLLPTLDDLILTLKQYAKDYAKQPMLARTHGQPATPTTVGKEIANVVARLERQHKLFLNTPLLGKMNGASGNYNALAVAYPMIDWPSFSKTWITELGLTFNAYTTQIEPHDYLAELFGSVMRINTILIDYSRDMWGYIALNYFKQKPVAKEVGSSTMPHKVNPIDFENAEGNLGLANALFDHMAQKLPISRWQRDLSDSTVLRNIGTAFAYTLLAYQSLLKGIQKTVPNPSVIEADLDQHWEVLAEPIQMVLRRFGIADAYEKLKTFSRGQKIDKESLHTFIRGLPLPDEIKFQLCQLTPSTYLGYAVTLAQNI